MGVIPGGDHTEVSEAVDIPIVTGLGSARDNINGRLCGATESYSASHRAWASMLLERSVLCLEALHPVCNLR